MLQPTGLVHGLAGLMLVTSTYCVARLVVARLGRRTLHRDSNIAHTADGVAMAGMLVSSLRTLPTGAWEVIFAALTIWFGVRGAQFVWSPSRPRLDGDHLSHYLSHLVMSSAMFYMFVEGSGTATGTGSSPVMAMGAGGAATSNLTVLTLLFVLVLFASAVWHADNLTHYTTVRPALAAAAATTTTAAGAATTTTTMTTTAAVSDEIPNRDIEGAADPVDADQARWLAPRLEMLCHIALCITMGYMLILML
jgi:hypothetical protein